MTNSTTYWNNKGMHQEAYDKIWECLIPNAGEADNMHAEAVRCISRVYYDYFNNGFCNALEYGRWTEYYKDMMDIVWAYLKYDSSTEYNLDCALRSNNDNKIEEALERLADTILGKAQQNITEEEYLAGRIQKLTLQIADLGTIMKNRLEEGDTDYLDYYTKQIMKYTNELRNLAL